MDKSTPVSEGTARIETIDGLVSVDLFALSIEVIRGPEMGARILSEDPCIRVGTDADSDLVLTDSSVSRQHLEFRVKGSTVWVKDRNSTNGTFLGPVQITEAELPPGTVSVRLGSTELRVQRDLKRRHSLREGTPRFGHLVGQSAPMERIFGVLQAVAPSTISVLLTGETGSGKEAAARTVHDLSGRQGPFLTFDASSADTATIRSDLFGHKRGAFTGAEKDRLGAVRKAEGGTLFLDEIGELPLDLQPRLLRLLEAKEVTPLGSDVPVPAKVRVVAATHRNLAELVEKGTFREDLFQRLAALPLHLPPLRERLVDLPLLVQHFVREKELNLNLSSAAEQALKAYPWPGNVRELRNVLERAAALAGGATVQPAHLGLPQSTNADGSVRPLEEVERDMIRAAVSECQGDKVAAAELLGISLSTLRRRFRQGDS